MTATVIPSHSIPSPTPIPSSRSPNAAAVVNNPVEQKFLREKIATALLIIYSVCGFVSEEGFLIYL